MFFKYKITKLNQSGVLFASDKKEAQILVRNAYAKYLPDEPIGKIRIKRANSIDCADMLQNLSYGVQNENARLRVERDATIDALLNICEEECSGDSSAGIASCPLYQPPDLNAKGQQLQGKCKAKEWRGTIRIGRE